MDAAAAGETAKQVDAGGERRLKMQKVNNELVIKSVRRRVRASGLL
jgi:hypothetical protein